jgi:hypothetical protein
MMMARMMRTPAPTMRRHFMFFHHIWRLTPEAPFLNWIAPCSKSAKKKKSIPLQQKEKKRGECE